MSDVLEEYRSRLRAAMMKLSELQLALANERRLGSEPIAIIGMGCRFPPDADSPEAFWRQLDDGLDAVGEAPAGRFAGAAAIDASAEERRAARWGAFLRRVDSFDHACFGLAPREAASLDPQQRLLLEVTWEALERAGQPVDALAGSRTGVFVGLTANDYAELALAAAPDVYAITGNGHCFPAGRLAYSFGFQGPAMAVDTACSSSLVAVHLACQSLRAGESMLAIAGGVSLMLSPRSSLLLAKSQALSPDGRCKTFDAAADGFVRGEGCGVVVLKRLSDAERDGDPILALVRGSAVNQDGRSTGLTAPNVLAQEAMLRQALEAARLLPDDVDYIETHGTGTSLGDPVELEALTAVFGRPRADGSSCVLGAVKTNIGHLEAAAGIAGLIKVVGCLGAERIPRNLHFRALNPRLTIEGTPFVIPTRTLPWPAGGRRRRAGVSGFGLSGTNAHVLVEEAPVAAPLAAAPPSLQLLPLSARDEGALVATARAHAERLAATAPDELADVVYSAGVRRAHHAHRLAVVGATGGELAAALDSWTRGEAPAAVVAAVAAERKPRSLFVFSGQGSQWAGMGRRLRESEPVFRDVLNECDALVQQHAGWSLLERLDDAEQLSRTEVAQPAIVAVELALVALLAEWGVKPDAVIGHSVGEIAAAKVAGVLTLGEAMRLACVRGRIMQAATGKGRMVAATMAAGEAAKYVEGELAIAAVNDPGQVVFAGPSAQIETLTGRLTAAGVRTRPLRVDYAFHSPQMAPLAAQLEADLGWLEPAAATLPLYSTVSGGKVTSALDRNYWARNVLQTVRMAEATAAAALDGQRLFVEVGPHATLTQNLEASLAERGDARVLPTLRRDRDDAQSFAVALAGLYTAGQPLAFARRWPSRRRLVPLPTYAWQRQRHWVTPEPDASAAAELVHTLAWRPLAPPPATAPAGHWALLDGDAALAAALTSAGAQLSSLADAAADADALAAWLSARVAAAGPLRGVLLDGGGDVATRLARALALLQAVTRLGAGGPRLWLVNRGADGGDDRALAAAALSGFGRQVAAEHPESWGGLVDVATPPGGDAGRDAAALAAWLLAAGEDAAGEDAARLVDGVVHVPRLERAPAATAAVAALDGEAAYLVSGPCEPATYGLVGWLAARGARHITLAGLAPTADAAALAAAAAPAARVTVIAAALTDDDAARLLGAGAGGRRLAGLIHVGSRRDDGVLLHQSADRLVAALAPSALAAAALDRQSRALGLDFFVVLTSTASLLGRAGRGSDSISAAVSAAVVAARRAAGHGASCLQIGADLETRPAEALPLVARLVAAGCGHAVLVGGPAADEAAGALWADQAVAAAPSPPSLRARLDETPAVARRAVLADGVQREVERVLGIVPPARAATSRGFFDLGMDSLMAVELKNRLQRALGQPLLPTLAFDHPSIDALTAYLAAELLDEPPAVVAAAVAPARDQLLAEVSSLSDDELAGVIDDELARLLSPSPARSRP